MTAEPAVSVEIVREIEQVEMDGWVDLYAAPSADLRRQLGIAREMIDDGVLLMCRTLDNIQFNRLFRNERAPDLIRGAYRYTTRTCTC